MAKTLRKAVTAGTAFILAAAGLSAAVLLGGCAGMSSESFEAARADALNTVIETTGLKTALDSELRARGYEIVGEYGLPNELADQIVDSLSIEDWEVTVLPQDVAQTADFTVDIEGNPIEITTYDDNSVVTVGAYGQEITFAVPSSAQVYVPYLHYLEYLKDYQAN